MADDLEELRTKVATSCRILGMLGLVSGTTGHVSARIPGTDDMWIRCRGGDEFGHTFTGRQQIRQVDFDGKGPELGLDHASPHETPIHGEIYRARPEVQAVVHAHPPYALRCGITNLEFKPVFGAYDPSALDIVLRGVPVFPRSVLVSNKEVADEMLAAMRDRDVLLMRGHGIVVTGPTVEAATTQAIRFDELARIMWDLTTSGLPLTEISERDRATFGRGPSRHAAPRMGWQNLPGVETWGWRGYVKLLEINNIGLP